MAAIFIFRNQCFTYVFLEFSSFAGIDVVVRLEIAPVAWR